MNLNSICTHIHTCPSFLRIVVFALRICCNTMRFPAGLQLIEKEFSWAETSGSTKAGGSTAPASGHADGSTLSLTLWPGTWIPWLSPNTKSRIAVDGKVGTGGGGPAQRHRCSMTWRLRTREYGSGCYSHCIISSWLSWCLILFRSLN